MHDYKKYYEEKLYPLQDGILSIVKEQGSPFYLTGGTALSRAYYQHRYSDDLDFFLNMDPDFDLYVENLIQLIKKKSLKLQIEIPLHMIIKHPDYCTFQILDKMSKTRLKIDLVNDIEFRTGNPVMNLEFGQLDTWQNILTNKLGALFRFEAKDYVDLWAISMHQIFSWKDMIAQARQKDVGLDPVIIADIISDVPIERLAEIKWVEEVNLDDVKKELSLIANDVLHGNDNTLYMNS